MPGTIRHHSQAADEPYAGEYGDPAITAHEAGHAVDYESADDKHQWLQRDYETELEVTADAFRDAVVEELTEMKRMNTDQAKEKEDEETQ